MDHALQSHETYRPLRGEGDYAHRRPSLWSTPMPETPGTGVSVDSGASEPLFGGVRPYIPPGDQLRPEEHRTFDAYLPKGSATATATPFEDVPATSPPPMATNANIPIAWRSDPYEKLAILLACLLPTIAGGLIFTGRIQDFRTTGAFLQLVVTQRAGVQIVVSIISAVLAALNVYIVTTLLNLGARIHILRKALDLTQIKFINTVATRQYGSGLPFPLFIGAAVTVLVFAIPNVMWTGALTPILVTSNSTQPSAIPLPQYSLASGKTWANNSEVARSSCQFVVNDAGIFSDCATATIQDSMLKHAATVSQNQTALHEKIDNGHYSYVGRSYGVGGAAGIFDGKVPGSLGGSTLLNYNYTETGYLTEVECSHNASMDFDITPIEGFQGEADNGTPSLFSAQGYFPWETADEGETNIEHFAVVGFDESSLAVLSCKESAPKGGTKMILMTAGSSYAFLNQTQCVVKMTPTLFAVNVDVTARLIRVEPQHTLDDDAFDPTGALTTTLVNQLNALSMIATSMYTSTVGDALLANINSTANASSTDLQRHAMLGDSFAAMFDDLLVFIGSSQFFLPFEGAGDWTSAPVQITMQAVQVGEAPYVIAVFILCVALILLVLEEAIRTALWRSLPRWDLTDPTCLVLAGAVAGPDLLRRFDQRDPASGYAVWSGDAREALGGARLRLGQKVVAVGGATSPSYPTSDAPTHGFLTYEGPPSHLSAVSFHTYHSPDTEPLR